MTVTDIRGQALSGADSLTAAGWDALLGETLLYAGDPLGGADALIQAAPRFVMPHLLKAWMLLLSTESQALPAARSALDEARALPRDAREDGHLAALDHLAEGRWWAASRVMEDVAIDHPRDLLALMGGHQIDFFTGHSRMLRDRVQRAAPAWHPSMPGWHAVQGMLAFGLEETGDYAGAERAGRLAIEAERRDGWARHAVAHVLEMQGRTEEGIGWLRGDVASWSEGSFLAVHNWWHLALYHLEMGDTATVLELVDGPVMGADTPVMLELLDMAAMLWRLQLRGVELGSRWQALADRFDRIWEPGFYAFNDLHALMAYLGAGREEKAQAAIEAVAEAAERAGDQARAARQVSLPLMRGFAAFHEGRYEAAIRAVRPVRGGAAVFGGSHAQRDVIDLTLIEAALRGGHPALARALSAERLAAKPESPFARLLAGRAERIAMPG
ncbi:tetratricopeptide repeat protein [Roseococcus sp. SYP-B2431]|uniref:tetratricopeptide repeat protein n=1 Tax=Roseococcus sp. SYP-B2431 TaxID=2496640 RepID=UPI0010408EBE|nr:tetratricopeptide repeat protein [Roseococcus sp. SYP-B2431]TCH98611.1 tetratricopeptide repeat protein [Roseococcus sp. SYP-B2431]